MALFVGACLLACAGIKGQYRLGKEARRQFLFRMLVVVGSFWLDWLIPAFARTYDTFTGNDDTDFEELEALHFVLRGSAG